MVDYLLERLLVGEKGKTFATKIEADMNSRTFLAGEGERKHAEL